MLGDDWSLSNGPVASPCSNPAVASLCDSSGSLSEVGPSSGETGVYGPDDGPVGPWQSPSTPQLARLLVQFGTKLVHPSK